MKPGAGVPFPLKKAYRELDLLSYFNVRGSACCSGTARLLSLPAAGRDRQTDGTNFEEAYDAHHITVLRW